MAERLRPNHFRKSITFYYTGPTRIQAGQHFGAEFSNDASNWSFILEEVRPAKDEAEARRLANQASSSLRKRGDSILSSLTLAGNGAYSLLSSNEGFEYRPSDGPTRLSASRRTSYSSLPPCTAAEKVPFINLGHPAATEGLKSMVSLFNKGKSAENVDGREALFSFYKVLETRAWLVKRMNTVPGTPDKAIITKGDDVARIWNHYNLNHYFDSAILREPKIQLNGKLEHANKKKQPSRPRESRILRAIRLCRNKRLVGHGVAKDPLSSVPLPIEEARRAAQAVIYRYAGELGVLEPSDKKCLAYTSNRARCSRQSSKNGFCSQHRNPPN